MVETINQNFSRKYYRMLCHSVSYDSFISNKDTLFEYKIPDWKISGEIHSEDENDLNSTSDIVDNPPSSSIDLLANEATEQDNDIFETMKSEKNRLESFAEKWPLNFISPENLSKYGFFYLQSEDKVQCAYCKVIIKNWKIGDNPMKEHIKHSPRCVFLIGSSTSELKKNTEHHSCPSLHNGTTSVRPKFPQMFDFKTRRSTYRNWTVSYLSPDLLAECGLFYTGAKDSVTCFCCGGTLGNWEINDDPWTEHKKFFPNCPFVQMKNVQTEGYSDNHLQEKVIFFVGPQAAMVLSASPKVTPVAKELFREASRIFPPLMVQNVMNSIQRKGQQLGSLHDLVEEILEYKQKEKIKEQKGQDEIPQMYAKFNHMSPVKQENEPKNDLQSIESDVPSSKNGPAEDIRQCRICMDRERGVLFQPCGHLIACVNCSRQLTECPICRQPIKDKVRCYL